MSAPSTVKTDDIAAALDLVPFQGHAKSSDGLFFVNQSAPVDDLYEEASIRIQRARELADCIASATIKNAPGNGLTAFAAVIDHLLIEAEQLYALLYQSVRRGAR